MTINWDILFKIGGLAGLVSLIWLLIKDLIRFHQRPKLQVTFKKDRDLNTFFFEDTKWLRKFANLHIKNNGRDTAKRCVAILRILKKPQGATNIEDEYALHWAGVSYTLQTTGAEPVDIGPEPRRLDVVFTHKGQKINGCWIAMPLALSGSLRRNQAYLIPGEYEVEIEVRCENGKGDKAKFKIISPRKWENLDFDEIRRNKMTKKDRRRKVTPEMIKRMKKLRGEGLPYMEIAEKLNLSYATVYNYLKKKEKRKVGFFKGLKRRLGLQ